eukprot:gene19035-biopygen8430
MYRPVALLPAIARLTEGVLVDKLKRHVKACKLLPRCQHGFREKHSCSTALTVIVQRIAAARNAGEVAVVASLDAASAFDAVPHELLLQKLERSCGIGGAPLQLLTSYFRGRRQRVRLQESTSGWRPIESGVAQGAVLSPLLYALYSIGIAEAVSDADVIQFADDGVARGASVASAVSKMDAALAPFHDWATSHRISPEPRKTQLMISAGPRRLKQIANVECKMAGTSIRPSETIKILGVLLDPQLSWVAHAGVAANKSRNAAMAVYRAARHLSIADRATLMAALAHPYLDYCQTPMVYPSAAASKCFVRAYNLSARLAARLPPDMAIGRKRIWRTKSAQRKLPWTTWDRRRAAHRAAEVSKIWHSDEPEQLRTLLAGDPSAQVTARVPRVRATMHPRLCIGEKAFAAWAPRVLTEVLHGTVLKELPDVRRSQNSTSRNSTSQNSTGEVAVSRSFRPGDEFEAQRRAYHGEVIARFHRVRQFCLCSSLPLALPSCTAASALALGQRSISPVELLAACQHSLCFREIYPSLLEHTMPRTLAWGDGSCTQDAGIAGSGVFYAMGDARNLAIRCPGGQTSDRSEVYSFLECIRRDPRALLFVTDNRYLHDGVMTHRHRWRSRAWFSHPLLAEYRAHADLWQRIDANLRSRPAHEVVTCWCRGHCRREEMLAGESTDLFVFGNCAVDALSKIGSQLPQGAERSVPFFDPTTG